MKKPNHPVSCAITLCVLLLTMLLCLLLQEVSGHLRRDLRPG